MPLNSSQEYCFVIVRIYWTLAQTVLWKWNCRQLLLSTRVQIHEVSLQSIPTKCRTYAFLFITFLLFRGQVCRRKQCPPDLCLLLWKGKWLVSDWFKCELTFSAGFVELYKKSSSCLFFVGGSASISRSQFAQLCYGKFLLNILGIFCVYMYSQVICLGDDFGSRMLCSRKKLNKAQYTESV